MTGLRGVRGEEHANHKLKERQVREIFRRAHAGEKQEYLACEFGINQRAISAIKLGKRWKHLNLLNSVKEGGDDDTCGKNN